MMVRFQGLHTVMLQDNYLPEGKTSWALRPAVERMFGGIGLQQVEGEDVFIGFHQPKGDTLAKETLFVATGEGTTPKDERIEAKLEALLLKLGVPQDVIQYWQKYSRQDYQGVYGHSPEFNEFHNSGRKVGVMVRKNRMALFRPGGELAFFPKKPDKNMIFVTDGPQGTTGDFYIMQDHYRQGLTNFLSRQLRRIITLDED